MKVSAKAIMLMALGGSCMGFFHWLFVKRDLPISHLGSYKAPSKGRRNFEFTILNHSRFLESGGRYFVDSSKTEFIEIPELDLEKSTYVITSRKIKQVWYSLYLEKRLSKPWHTIYSVFEERGNGDSLFLYKIPIQNIEYSGSMDCFLYDLDSFHLY